MAFVCMQLVFDTAQNIIMVSQYLVQTVCHKKTSHYDHTDPSIKSQS